MSRSPLRTAALVALATAALGSPAAAQGPPRGVPADTVRVPAAAGIEAAPVGYPQTLAAGDRVAVWVEGRVRATVPDAGGLPVPDAAPGALVARFGSSGAFAWPERPIVWTAPRAGGLSFGVNARSAHGPSGEARVVVVPLDPASRAAFAAPEVRLERTGGGFLVTWRDRAGFGVDRRTLALHLVDSHGTRIRLAAWAPAGEGRAVLPLPPPVDLPPGIHTLSAEITDGVGNTGRSAAVRFGWP